MQTQADVYQLVIRRMSILPAVHQVIYDDRNDYQSTLAACTRVSKLWHKYASPVLYRIPVVRSLPRFIIGMDNPAIGGLTSKADHFACVERLFLETDQKPSSTDTTEEDLTLWSRMSGEADREVCKVNFLKGRAVQEIVLAWQTLIRANNQMTSEQRFPRLRTISTNALAGVHRPPVWPPRFQFHEWALCLQSCQEALTEFLLDSSQVRHYCGTGPPGPLSLLDSRGYPAITDGFRGTITTHSSIKVPNMYPVAVGIRTRYYVHPAADGWRPQKEEDDLICKTTRAVVNFKLRYRSQFANDPNFAAAMPSLDVTGGLYVGLNNPPPGLSEAQQRIASSEWADRQEKEMTKLLKAGKEGLPVGLVVNDSFEVKPAHKTPPCEACGWRGSEGYEESDDFNVVTGGLARLEVADDDWDEDDNSAKCTIG